MRHRTPSAASYLGISRRTLEKWRVVGGGPPFAKLGGVVVYDERDLEEFVRERLRSSTSAEPKDEHAA